MPSRPVQPPLSVGKENRPLCSAATGYCLKCHSLHRPTSPSPSGRASRAPNASISREVLRSCLDSVKNLVLQWKCTAYSGRVCLRAWHARSGFGAWHVKGGGIAPDAGDSKRACTSHTSDTRAHVGQLTRIRHGSLARAGTACHATYTPTSGQGTLAFPDRGSA